MVTLQFFKGPVEYYLAALIFFDSGRWVQDVFDRQDLAVFQASIDRSSGKIKRTIFLATS